MKVSRIKATEDKMTFTLNDSYPAFANALRRALMTDVPVMAIEEVDFFENNSVMFDEYLAHRLALIPLTTDLKTYKLPEECCGGNCGRCSVMLSLEAEGPKTVYSGELKTKDAKIKPVEKKIPIIKLGKNQRVRLEAKAVLGTARKHAKHQSCFVTYKALPVVELTKDCSNCGNCVKACPVGILEKGAKKIKVTDAEKCIQCMECVEQCPEGAIKVGHDRSTFLFTLESFGNLKPKELLKAALESLDGKVTDTEKFFK